MSTTTTPGDPGDAPSMRVSDRPPRILFALRAHVTALRLPAADAALRADDLYALGEALTDALDALPGGDSHQRRVLTALDRAAFADSDHDARKHLAVLSATQPFNPNDEPDICRRDYNAAVCPGCNSERDLDTCHCGAAYADHNPYYENHTYSPTGCVCYLRVELCNPRDRGYCGMTPAML